MDGTALTRPCRTPQMGTQFEARRLVRVLSGRGRRLPRGQWFRPAGRLSRRTRRVRLAGAPEGICLPPAHVLNVDYQYDRNGDLISRNVMPGVGMDVPRDGFLQFRYHDEQARAGDVVLGQRRIGYVAQFSPTTWLSQISVDGLTGGQIDFENVRPGHGSTIESNARLNPTRHLELALLQNLRWLDVDTPTATGRLFTARVSRIRATYAFTSRLFVRGIGQS